MFRNVKHTVSANFMIVLSFLLLSILSSIFLLKVGRIYNGADFMFHLNRINEFIISLKHHSWPFFSFNFIHGSSVMYMYPYLNLLPWVLASFIIKSNVILFYLFLIFNVFLCMLISFYSSFHSSKSIKTSYTFSIIYSFSGYFWLLASLNGAFGQASGYIFFPLILFGFYDLLHGYHNYYKLSLGISLILFSHIPYFLISIMFIFILIIININRINFKFILEVLKSFTLSVFLSCPILVPMIYFLAYNYKMITTPKVVNFYGDNLLTFTKSSLGGLSYGIGLFPSLALLLSIIFYKKFNKSIKKLYLLSILITFMSTKLMPWNSIFIPKFIKMVLNHFQFASRFFVLPILILSYILSLIVTKYSKIKNAYVIVIFCSLFITAVNQYRLVSKVYSFPSISNMCNVYKPKYNTNKYSFVSYNQLNRSYHVDFNGYDDYFPKKSIPYIKYIMDNDGFTNNKNILKFHHIGYNMFSFNNKRFSKLTIPFVFYNKEHVNLYLNNKLVHYSINNNKMPVVNHICKGHNTLRFKYIPNLTLLVMRNILFCIGIMWLIILIIYKIHIEYIF